MYPHIVRHIDESLLNYVITQYKTKKSIEITAEEWQLIAHYHNFIRISTWHLLPDIKEPVKILKIAEENNEFIRSTAIEFDEAFQKRYKLYCKIAEKEQRTLKAGVTNLDTKIKNNQWDIIFSNELPNDLANSVFERFWISLFENINFNANWLEQIDTSVTILLQKIINTVFKNSEDDRKKYSILLRNPENYNIIINVIAKINLNYQILSIFSEQRNKIENNDPPHKFLTTLLHAQRNYYKNRQQDMFYRDATRGTTIQDIDIKDDLTISIESRPKTTIEQVIKRLKDNQVGNNLIEYILLYVHQHGISQSGSNFFQDESFNFGFTFTYNDKQVRIEILSPTKIRIVSPVLYDACAIVTDTGIALPPTRYPKVIRYEVTSIMIEETNINSNSPSSIEVSTNNCFYELSDQELMNTWHLAMLKNIVVKLSKNIALENIERNFLEPYITQSLHLKPESIKNASPGMLVFIMLNNYSYAIEIMRDPTLINKILNSEFNIYFYNIYEAHKSKLYFYNNAQNMLLWQPFIDGKKTFNSLLTISEQLTMLQNEQSGDKTNILRAIKICHDELRSLMAKFNNQKYIFDVLRTYNNNDKIKLLKISEIACSLSVEQFMELIKCGLEIAIALLEPLNISQKDLSNHAINKLSQTNLLDIIITYPELWTTDEVGFGRKQLTTSLLGNRSSRHGKPYRYLLTPDSLVACVFSDNNNVRRASIDAIAKDSKLIETLLDSNKLKTNNSDEIQLLEKNLLRLYFESPLNIQSQIEKNPVFVRYLKHIMNSDNPIDKKIVTQFAIPIMKNIPIDNLMGDLRNLFTKNIATSDNIDKYIAVINYHLQRDTRDKMIFALTIHPENLFIFAQHVITHNYLELYELLFHILMSKLDDLNVYLDQPSLVLPKQVTLNMLAVNLFNKYCIENYFTSISNQELLRLYRNLLSVMDKLSLINNSKTADETSKIFRSVISSPDFKAAVMNRIFNRVDRPKLNTIDYNLLARLYVRDADWRTIINTRPLLLKGIIENANIVLISEMLNSNSSLITNIIQAFTSNTEMRDRILGKADPTVNSIPEITDFLSKISSYMNESELRNFYQLIKACKVNEKIDLISLAQYHPLMLPKDQEAIANIFNEMSRAKNFIAMSLSDGKELVKDIRAMDAIIQSATRAELNVIFSSYPSILMEWQSKISSPNNHFSFDIRKSIIDLSSEAELAKIYLYSDKINKDIILHDELLVDFMLTNSDNIYFLYKNDIDMRTKIETSNDYTNMLLSSNYPSYLWFSIYLKANDSIREKIVANDKILDKLLLMTSQNNLLILIQTQVKLAPIILQKLFEYYHTTEYMKWFVNLQPKLLHEMLHHLRNDQLILLLISKPKNELIDAIIENRAFCQHYIEDYNRLSKTIPNYDKTLDKILSKHPDLKALLQQRDDQHKAAIPSFIVDEIEAAKNKTKVNSNPTPPPSSGLDIKSS